MRELLARMGSDELTDWMAYSRLEPWGLEMGVIAAMLFNINRSKDAKPISPAEALGWWVPDEEAEETPIDPETGEADVAKFFQQFG